MNQNAVKEKTVLVVSLMTHLYALRMQEPGDEYEAEEAHVPALVALGRVKLKEKEDASRNQYNRRDMQPEGTTGNAGAGHQAGQGGGRSNKSKLNTSTPAVNGSAMTSNNKPDAPTE